MKTMANERIGEEVFENLFNQNFPPADAFAIQLRAGQGELARGTVLALSTGTASKNDMVILGAVAVSDETLAANCILAESIDTGEASGATVTGLAYRTGHFNGNKLTVKQGYTMTAADKEALRAGGILLSDAEEV